MPDESLDVTKGISIFSVIGLSLLYTSAYFLPLVTPGGAYLLPSRDLFHWVIMPSLVATAVGGVLVYCTANVARRWCPPRVATGLAIIALSLLTLIAFKGILSAAGYDPEDLIPRAKSLQTSARYLKVSVFLVLVAAMWALRGLIPAFVRMLSSAGFAFGVLAAIRMIVVATSTNAMPVASTHAAPTSLVSNAHPVDAAKPRRVVWVIFDEADLGRLYGSDGAIDGRLTNFRRLQNTAVFAVNARSPASATFFSLPALLAGVPLGGEGVRIHRGGTLSLQREDGKLIPFGESTSIFGALDLEGQTSSVLGFYHPYCKLFVLQSCDSFAWPEVGGAAAAIWANVPNGISSKLRHFDYWEHITKESIQLVPSYVARGDALTFMHLNVPHLSATYADEVLHLSASSDPLIEYSRNLALADQILGEIVDGMEKQASSHDLLLVVSSDHWLRNRWYRADQPEVSRPIPLIIWKVGETRGFSVPQPLSTVHTEAMILDYLHGKVTTQAEIADWWNNQPFHPSFMAPGT